MSAQVNLLPPELAQKKRAQRTTRLTIIGVAAWLAVLGGLFVVKDGQVQEAMADRDAAQAEVQRLQTQVAELDEYRLIAAQLDARQALLTDAMSDEVSWARILGSLLRRRDGEAWRDHPTRSARAGPCSVLPRLRGTARRAHGAGH